MKKHREGTESPDTTIYWSKESEGQIKCETIKKGRVNKFDTNKIPRKTSIMSVSKLLSHSLVATFTGGEKDCEAQTSGFYTIAFEITLHVH